MFRTSEELIETLEENQVQLQNMMTSKYISFFIEEISAWQKRLSMVDQVGLQYSILAVCENIFDPPPQRAIFVKIVQKQIFK